MKGPDIGIVGAGLGGMTAAVALQQRGFRVTVYEQAQELGEIGAGITVGPNISVVLAGLGLEDAAATFADGSTTFGALHYKTGEPIWFSERSIEEALETRGALTRHMHRAGPAQSPGRRIRQGGRRPSPRTRAHGHRAGRLRRDPALR